MDFDFATLAEVIASASSTGVTAGGCVFIGSVVLQLAGPGLIVPDFLDARDAGMPPAPNVQIVGYGIASEQWAAAAR